MVSFGGGHGGGDPLLRDELFIGPDPQATVAHQAGLEDGIDVVLTGYSLYQSVLQHKLIDIDALRKDVWKGIK